MMRGRFWGGLGTGFDFMIMGWVGMAFLLALLGDDWDYDV